MPTHGKARNLTENALSNREAFRRAGFGMSAVTGPAATLGQLPEPYRAQYRAQESAGLIAYTVLSYQTPILWVLTGGTVIYPDVRYSVTTSNHQGFARTHVNGGN